MGHIAVAVIAGILSKRRIVMIRDEGQMITKY